MHKPIFLLLGGNKLNYGILRKFQKLGYLVYVIDWNEKPQMTGDKFYRIDVKDFENIIKKLKDENVWKYVKFAYSSIDVAVKSVAYLNRKIGLKTITDDGLRYTSSKSMMVKKWKEKKLLNRVSLSFKEYNDEIEKLNKKVNIIIKPDNSSSSRGITIIKQNSSKNCIIDAFGKAYIESKNGIVVIEEFVEGTEFTVDMIGDAYGNVCVYGISRKSHTKNTINNRIAVKLHYNSVDYMLQNKIAEYGIACYKALGFSASLGHLEIVLKTDGDISPLEIGARSSGFIASDLVDIVSGSDYLLDLIDVQKGARIENGLHQQENKSSIYFFYDFPEGFVVKNEYSIMDFLYPPIISRYYDRSKISPGKCFTNIDNDNARIGFEIIEGPKDILTAHYIEEVEKKMLMSIAGEK